MGCGCSKMVMVYRNGTMLRTDISMILDKTPMVNYKRYTDEPLQFATIAKPSDALLTCYCDPDRNCYRLDDVKNLRAGLIGDKGIAMIATEFDHLGTIDIVPSSLISQMKRIYNLKSTNPGYNITNVSEQREVKLLNSIGIQLLE